MTATTLDARVHHTPERAGELIDATREACTSHAELAARCGVTPDYLLKLRKGERNMTYALQVTLEHLADLQLDARQQHNTTSAGTLIDDAQAACGTRTEVAARAGVSLSYLYMLTKRQRDMSFPMQVILAMLGKATPAETIPATAAQ